MGDQFNGIDNQNNQDMGSQVYFDQNNGQYFTLNNQNNNPFLAMFGNKGISAQDRNYLSNYLNNQSSQNIAPYPTMSSLFPSLNAGLSQNIQNITSGQESSGAGRFLAPSLLSTNTSKGE